MKKMIHGIRAWMVECWHGGDDDPYECLEISRTVYLDKALANRAYDRHVIQDTVRKVVLSEIDIFPDKVLRKTVSV